MCARGKSEMKHPIGCSCNMCDLCAGRSDGVVATVLSDDDDQIVGVIKGYLSTRDETR